MEIELSSSLVEKGHSEVLAGQSWDQAYRGSWLEKDRVLIKCLCSAQDVAVRVRQQNKAPGSLPQEVCRGRRGTVISKEKQRSPTEDSRYAVFS